MVYEEGKTCENCCDIAMGTIGNISDLDNLNNHKYVCRFCYIHIEQLRYLGFKWTIPHICEQLIYLSSLKKTPRVLFAIEKYKERLQDA